MKGLLLVTRRIAKYIILADIAVIVVTGVVCWLIGWRSWPEYATALEYACLAVAGFGGIFVLSSSGLSSSRPHLQGIQLQEFYTLRTKERNKNFDFFFLSVLIAIPLYGTAVLIHRFAG